MTAPTLSQALLCLTAGLGLEPRLLRMLVSLTRRAAMRFRLGTGLAPRVPLVVTTAVLLASFAAAAGAGGVSAYSLALAPPLFLLALVDARAYWLPFSVTLPLAFVGTWLAALEGRGADALLGGLLWGCMPAAIAELHRLLRGRAGLGFGDVALMAAIGVWCGPERGALAVFAAAAMAIAAILLMQLTGMARVASPRVPLGPFLCLGFFAATLAAPV